MREILTWQWNLAHKKIARDTTNITVEYDKKTKNAQDTNVTIDFRRKQSARDTNVLIDYRRKQNVRVTNVTIDYRRKQ